VGTDISKTIACGQINPLDFMLLMGTCRQASHSTLKWLPCALVHLLFPPHKTHSPLVLDSLKIRDKHGRGD
jgi:hypothetical protein